MVHFCKTAPLQCVWMKSVCWYWRLDIISTSGKKSCILRKEGGLWDNARGIRTVWFIKAFSSHSLFQDWLSDGIADLHLCPVTSLLDCTSLVWFLPCASRQWVPLPKYRAGFVVTREGSELGMTLPEWSIIGPRNYSHSKEFVWPWGYYMVKMPETLCFYIFHLIIHFSHQNGMTADKELYWTITESRTISLVLETRSNG